MNYDGISTKFRYSTREVTKRPYNLLAGFALEQVQEKEKAPTVSDSHSTKVRQSPFKTPEKPASQSQSSPEVPLPLETPPPGDVSVTFIASTPKVGPQLSKKRKVSDVTKPISIQGYIKDVSKSLPHDQSENSAADEIKSTRSTSKTKSTVNDKNTMVKNNKNATESSNKNTRASKKELTVGTSNKKAKANSKKQTREELSEVTVEDRRASERNKRTIVQQTDRDGDTSVRPDTASGRIQSEASTSVNNTIYTSSRGKVYTDTSRKDNNSNSKKVSTHSNRSIKTSDIQSTTRRGDKSVLSELSRNSQIDALVRDKSSTKSVSSISKKSNREKASVPVRSVTKGSGVKKSQTTDQTVQHEDILKKKSNQTETTMKPVSKQNKTKVTATRKRVQSVRDDSLLVDQSQENFKIKASKIKTATHGKSKSGGLGEEQKDDSIESEAVTVMVLDNGDRRRRRDVLDVDVALSFITDFIKRKSDRCHGMRDRKVLQLLEKYIVQDLSSTVNKCQSLRQLQSRTKKHTMSIKEKQSQLFTLQKKRMELECKCRPMEIEQSCNNNMTKLNKFVTDMRTLIANC